MDTESSSVSKYYVMALILAMFVLIGIVFYLSEMLQTDIATQNSNANTQQQTIPAKELIISNVSSSSVTISWITDTEATGYIKYGDSEDTKATLVRDIQDTVTSVKRTVHYVTISRLSPGKTYLFDIFVNDAIDATATTKTFQTAPIAEDINAPTNLIVEAASTFTGGTVYAHAKNQSGISTTVSARATNNKFLLSLGNLKVAESYKPFDLSDAYVYVSATDSSGNRVADVFKVDTQRKKLTNTNSTTPEYVMSKDFSLPSGLNFASNITPNSGSTGGNTNTNTTNTTNTNTNNNTVTPTTNTPAPTVTPPTTVLAAQTNVTQIPKTAISASDFVKLVYLFFGVMLLVVGISLSTKKQYR